MGNSPTWEELAKSVPPTVPRTADAVGVRCAAGGCGATKGISYSKPLCYEHWKDFDKFRIFECEQCHWFDEMVGEFGDDDVCYECFDRKRRGFGPTPVYLHGPVEYQVHHLYIFKLDGGQFYVGQTNDLESRLGEHKDDMTASTKGKHPRLVWFQKIEGNRDEVNAQEDELTRLALNSPRVIRRMVEQWRKPLRLVDLIA